MHWCGVLITDDLQVHKDYGSFAGMAFRDALISRPDSQGFHLHCKVFRLYVYVIIILMKRYGN